MEEKERKDMEHKDYHAEGRHEHRHNGCGKEETPVYGKT